MNDRCDCCRKNLRGQQKYLSPIDTEKELCAKCLDDTLAELGMEDKGRNKATTDKMDLFK